MNANLEGMPTGRNANLKECQLTNQIRFYFKFQTEGMPMWKECQLTIQN